MSFCALARYDGSMRTRLLSLALAAAALAGCQRHGTEPQAAAEFPKLPSDYVLVSVKHYLTEDGIRRGLLNADTGYVHVDSAKFDLHKVHLLLYNANGQEAADLVSKTGELDQRTNAMVARGNVVLVGRGSGVQRIETEELHYDPNTHQLWSTVSSRVTQKGNVVTTQGFKADDQLQRIEMKAIRGRVEGRGVTF